MKSLITLFSLCLFSTVIHASEVTSLSDIKDLEGQTLELKVGIRISGMINALNLNAEFVDDDQFCQTTSTISYERANDVDIRPFYLKKGALLVVKSVKAESGLQGFNIGGNSPLAPYAHSKLELFAGVNDQGKDITFSMNCVSTYGPLLSTHKVKSDVVQMINNLFKI